ncbi:unnamed protein product, partial [Prorocentrum cordatum]
VVCRAPEVVCPRPECPEVVCPAVEVQYPLQEGGASFLNGAVPALLQLLTGFGLGRAWAGRQAAAASASHSPPPAEEQTGERRQLAAKQCIISQLAVMASCRDFVLLKYADVDEELYHEVMITGISPEDPAEVTLYTADGDHYQFNIAPGDDVEAQPLRNAQRHGLERADAGRAWVYAEDHGRQQKGDILEELPAWSVVLGERAVVPTPEGGAVFLQMNAIEEYKIDDLRVLPVKFDAMGRRKRPFYDGVSNIVPDEVEGGLGLEAPGTVAWRCQTYVDRSQTPASQHAAWRSTSGISNGGRSVFEHEVLSEVLESMGMMVAPSLQRHVSTSLRDEHQVAKEQRKARVERRLGRQNKNPKKGQAGQG